MKSWPSKIPTSLALISACGLFNSCQLGAGKYSSQTEIETEVPESLEQGRASQGPPTGQTAYAAASGVPSDSNLLETTASVPSTTALPSLPGSTAGGAAIPSNQADPGRSLIDIPKPEFTNVSLHNPRTPATMLTLDSPSSSASARMSLPPGSRPASVAQETIKPLPPVSPPADIPAPSSGEAVEVTAPKALSAAPPPASDAPAAEPGIPLLHSSTKLSDFYAALHEPLLEQAVVENTTPAIEPDPAPAAADAELPPPPPAGETAFGSPAPQ